jgi:hypothetical protein
MQKLSSIFVFYKQLMLWSFGVNILLIIVTPKLIPAIATKLFLVAILWFFMNENKAEFKFVCCRTSNISKIKLLIGSLIIDICITIAFILIIREYI